jgi:hypothetical protein
VQQVVEGPTTGTNRAAFEWAARARAARHGVREDLAGGRTELADVLAAADADPFVGQVRLLWTLESLPGARKTDTRRRLEELGLDGTTPIGALDATQRRALLQVFPLGEPS